MAAPSEEQSSFDGHARENSLSCSNITVSYGTGRLKSSPLRRVDFTAQPGVPVALMGPSGSGKTTLLRILAGLQRPASGSVYIGGDSVSPRRDGTVDPRVSMVYQDFRLVDFLTVAENLQLAAESRGLRSALSTVSGSLASVGLSGFEARMPATLSGGEQQRVAIARAVLVAPRILLADEPTGSLDARTTKEVTDALVTVARERRIVLVVATHDRRVADSLSRLLYLDSGQLREDIR